jgi:hypothetical protein
MQTNDRCGFLAGLSAATTLLWAGCESEPKHSSTATLFNNSEVHAAIKALADALNRLDDAIQEFDADNWRDVVPNVRTAAGDASSAFGTLQKSLGYIAPDTR